MKRLQLFLLGVALAALALACDDADEGDLPPCIDPPPPCITCPVDYPCGQPCTDEGAWCLNAHMTCNGGRWTCFVPNPPTGSPSCLEPCR